MSALGTFARPVLAFSEIDKVHFFPHGDDSFGDERTSSSFTGRQINNIPSSAWQTTPKNTVHFGFAQKHILIKISGVPGANTSIVIGNRFLSQAKVFALLDNDFITPLFGKNNPGFDPTISYEIPPDTQTLLIEAKAHLGLAVPIDIMSQDQQAQQASTSLWSLGIFFGLALLSLLICAFQYAILKQRCLGLAFVFIACLILYILSKSQLYTITKLPLGSISTFWIQALVMSALAVGALYTQLASQEHLVDEKPNTVIARLFSASAILVVLPLLGYFVVQNTEFVVSTFKILHLPGLLLAFIISSIASAMAHKRYPEQGYLFMAWLIFGTSLILEGSSFLGISHSHLANADSLTDLSGIFMSLTTLFLTFWALNHTAIVHKERIEAIQTLFENLVERNQELEINHARAADLAQSIYKEIKTPTLGLLKQLQQSVGAISPKEIQSQVKQLHATLQKLTLLSQDLNHPIHASQIIFDLHRLLEKVPLAFTQQAAAAHITITTEIDGYLPERLNGDQSLLYKALLLIIEHRIQAMRSGTIRLRALRANDPRSPQVHMELRIEDTAPPMRKSSIDQFSSHSPTLGSRDFQLILARDMIFAMGGEFKIHHEVGLGNCFTCRLIMDRAATPPPNQEMVPALPNKNTVKRVLCFTQELNYGEQKAALAQLDCHSLHAQDLNQLTTTLLIESLSHVFIDARGSSEPQTLVHKIYTLCRPYSVSLITLMDAPGEPSNAISEISKQTHVILDLNVDTLRSALFH